MNGNTKHNYVLIHLTCVCVWVAAIYMPDAANKRAYLSIVPGATHKHFLLRRFEKKIIFNFRTMHIAERDRTPYNLSSIKSYCLKVEKQQVTGVYYNSYQVRTTTK